MRKINSWASLAILLAASPLVRAESVHGIYLEARSGGCVSSGGASACSSGSVAAAPAQAVLAWQVREGGFQGVDLAGRSIVALLTVNPAAGDAAQRAQLLVDEQASAEQRQALVALARSLAPACLPTTAVARPARLDVRIGEGCARGCGVISCDLVQLRTRKLDESEAPPGTESTPLAQVFSNDPAFTVSLRCGGDHVAEATNVATAVTGSFSR